DVVIPLCGPGMKIIRTWKVYDWCQPIGTPDNPWTCTQVIKLMDTTPPALDLPDTLTVGTQSTTCSAQPVLPPATITDCSDVTVQVLTPAGIIDGNGGQVPAPGLEVGTHTVTYLATDACDNTGTRQVVVVVVDDDEPVAVCDDFTVVSLNSDGTGELMAQTIDDGSLDNCCISHFEVRRMDDNCGLPANTAFGPSVTFCCADLEQQHTVVMRVWDCHGNYNECMVTVEVQDKLPPVLTCPPDLTIDCGGDFLDLDLTGRVETDAALVGPNDGYAFDNCSSLEVTFADSGNIDCGEGVIARTWTVTDMDGNEVSCIQTITLENTAPYDGSGIVWPADVTVSGCGADIDPATTGTPQVPPSTACRQLMTGMNDVVLGTTSDACLKVLRTWFVIDWCQYDPNDPDSPGFWSHTQVIKVHDDEPPVLTGCTDRTFCNFKPDCSDIGVDLSVVVTDGCTPDSLVALSWEVDLFADGTTDDAGSGQNFMNPYPLGNHRITYTATDGCGNSTTCSFYFLIEDCKKPSPVCASGVAVELMQDGQVSVPVSMLVADASDNCSAADALVFSFSPDTDDTVRTFACDQLGSQQVQVWATDEAGNQDYCETIIVVQDNMNACGVPLIAIGGAIGNEEGEMVEDVVVELSGNDLFVQTTDATGHYMFADMMAGHDYTVTPGLDADPLNGVTTYDLVLMGRHIQQVQPLGSPYKLIAADVDGSGHISVSDMLELRQLILHTVPTFSNNSSWRFVPADYAFPDPANPFAEPFPEVINWNNLDADQMASDFVAIKVGDLNGSAVTNSLMAAEDRTEGWTPLRIASTAGPHLPKGETVEVQWLLDEADELAAAQFTFEWDAGALELLDFEPGNIASMANFGLRWSGEGRITASWDAPSAPAREGGVLARLTFRARRDVALADACRLSDALTPSRAWRPDGTPLALVLDTGDEGAAVAVGSVPNPFAGQTRIYCQLAQNEDVRLTLADLSGRVLWQYAGRLGPGRHEWRLDGQTVPAAGVYLLRLETDGATVVRKLVRTE
ncbi:MAG: T9SS C-terminal target domain-containing protein, partial [Bacteroidetes bacterium]